MKPINITFLFGNGFDKALGLHTGYDDFLYGPREVQDVKGYIESLGKYVYKRADVCRRPDSGSLGLTSLIETIKAHVQNEIYKWHSVSMRFKSVFGVGEPHAEGAYTQALRMKSGGGDWSNAELAFGKIKYSEIFEQFLSPDPAKNVEFVKRAYRAFYGDFTSKLKDHIAGENLRFDVSAADGDAFSFSKEFVRRIATFHHHLPHGHKKLVQEVIYGRGAAVINFITFNYTDTLEQLIHPYMDKPIVFVENKTEFKIGKLLHPHGSLTRGDVVFGVDNTGQIDDPLLKQVSESSGVLVKPRPDDNLGYDAEAEAMSLLDESDIVVLYGVSFGASDCRWWKKLADWHTQGGKYLVFCPYVQISNISRGSEALRMVREDCIRLLFQYDGVQATPMALMDDDAAKRILILDIPYRNDELDAACDYFSLSVIGEQVIARCREQELPSFGDARLRRLKSR